MSTISPQEVAKHNTKNDLWVIIHGKVYDLTKFLPEHPGGQKIIMKYAGKDATSAFEPIHPPDIIQRFLAPEVCMGSIDTEALSKVPKVETEEEKKIRLAREKMPKIDEMYNSFDFETVAKSVLKPDAWAYYSSGADDEISMRENHNAFHRIWLRPRVMVNVKDVDASTTMLGSRTSLPLYITATALGKLGHPEGEVVLTKAAKNRNIIQMIPTLASCSFDEIVDAATPDQTQWLQLYVNGDREVSKKFVCHAESRGIKGLFITADAPQLGRREKDMRQKYSQEDPDEITRNATTVNRDEGAARAISSFIDPSLCWDDVAWFKSITNMPILIKGIQTPEDAVLAAKHGCQGVVLSNHGGRQLDFAPSSIEILAETMEALKREGLDKDFEVYIDGGIRRGSDIFKAIALGAKGVGIGRPFLVNIPCTTNNHFGLQLTLVSSNSQYAMSAYGVEGVEKLLELLQHEFEMVMRLMGVTRIEDIKPEMVDIRNIKDHFVANPTDHLANSSYERMQPRGNLSKFTQAIAHSMASFDTTTATPSTVSELVAAPVATKENNSLQGPIVAPIDSGSVQAYAKLEGEELCYYMRTLQVSLGRKVSNPNNVDIPLGNTKSVSRQHAQLFYNFSSQRFELMVFGKNGAFVNERFVERGVTVPLENKTKIQIGEMAFVFLLPKKEMDNTSKKRSNAPKHNIEDFGYISTPHQLEKVTSSMASSNNGVPAPSTSPQEDRDDDDHDRYSETSETANPYSSKDIKPPYSYASLIAQAINSSDDKRLTLNGIYKYITTSYPYYQMTQNGWQNSIRHNLSLNKAFVKVPRGDTEPGKGAFWTIDSNAETQFTKGVYKRTKRAAGLPLSSHQKSEAVESAKKKLKREHNELEQLEKEEELATAESTAAEKLSNIPAKVENDSLQRPLALNENTPKTELSDTTNVAVPVIPVSSQQEASRTTSSSEKLSKTSLPLATVSKEVSSTPAEVTVQQQQQEAQAQLQLQLQNTIRQHLLDPLRYPLPPSIAQLLPQAIAQLPPQLATQLSSTLHKHPAKPEENVAVKKEESIITTATAGTVRSSLPSETDVENLKVVGSYSPR
ncbi:hypothetical protein [Parasitella parasitica]|uniref:L-lactate dehydrogenase (cytochrome) n=1 Tax=Parasitella parasitica TaxID=35722 RepID=A0A0B7NKU6_9FUNG|nr:hypothetical protein [Parasitella parasitica]